MRTFINVFPFFVDFSSSMHFYSKAHLFHSFLSIFFHFFSFLYHSFVSFILVIFLSRFEKLLYFIPFFHFLLFAFLFIIFYIFFCFIFHSYFLIKIYQIKVFLFQTIEPAIRFLFLKKGIFCFLLRLLNILKPQNTHIPYKKKID